ncbi:MAG: hypothetical protein KF730_15555 [Sphingomonas sp.]|uniref:hypothetical protein n=1 Tax=Sphingomonas sp. TaxID=28214 RepID=UPI0025DAB14E|nr:hypothetical protein [Sphingomonas sp.]MBX3565981.1 hypothetical protein [Sphingomonas sp.]
MPYYSSKEMTNEELDAWTAASDRQDAIAEVADEEGGPSLSLVVTADRPSPYPADLLPPAAAAGTLVDDAEPAIAAEPFDGVPLTSSRKRLAGWSAERQRLFLASLAETGSVHLAAADARLSARSAYRLRMRSPEFAAAWDTADQLAVGRLSALAFDRAINGRTEQVWHRGELMVEKRLPSDKLLTWLLARLDPRRFAAPWEQRKDAADPQLAAGAGGGDALTSRFPARS